MENIFFSENGTGTRASTVDVDHPSIKACPTLREMGGGKFESLAFKVGVPGFRLRSSRERIYAFPTRLERQGLKA